MFNVILLIIGMIIISYGLLIETDDLLGRFVINVVLFFSGLYIVLYSIKLLGWLE